MWWSIILLRYLSLCYKGTMPLNGFCRLNFSLKLHLVSINRWCTFWVGKVLWLKRWMMYNDWSCIFCLLLYVFWCNLIGIDWLRGHSLDFLLWIIVYVILFRMSINVDAIDILLYFLNDIWSFFILFEILLLKSLAFDHIRTILLFFIVKTVWFFMFTSLVF
jgi:hypothetical protein